MRLVKLSQAVQRQFKTVIKPFVTISRSNTFNLSRRNMSTQQYQSEYLHTTFSPQLPSPKLAPSFDSLESWPSDPWPLVCQWYAEAEDAYKSLPPSATVNWPNNAQIATCTLQMQPRIRNVLVKGLDQGTLLFYTNYEGAKGQEIAHNPRVAANFYWKFLERQVRIEGIAEKSSAADSDDYFHSRPLGSQISGSVSCQSRPIRDRVQLEVSYVREVQRVANALHDVKLNQSQESFQPIRVREVQSVNQSESSTSAHQHNDSFESDPSLVHAAHSRALESLNALESDPSMRQVLKHAVDRPSNWGGYRIQPTLVEFWCDGKFRLHSRIEYRKDEKTGEWTKRILSP